MMRGLFIALALFSASAWADCNVSLFSIYGQEVLLKAKCAAPVTGIEWLRNDTSLTGGVFVTLTPTAGDIFYTTVLMPGVYRYSARGRTASAVQAPGAFVTIITGRPTR